MKAIKQPKNQKKQQQSPRFFGRTLGGFFAVGLQHAREKDLKGKHTRDYGQERFPRPVLWALGGYFGVLALILLVIYLLTRTSC